MKFRRFKTILFVALLILALFLLNSFFYNNLKAFVFDIFSPIQKVLWSEKSLLSKSVGSFFRAKRLSSENQALYEENLILRTELLEIREMAEENRSLRQAFNIGLREDFDLMIAEIVSQKTKGSSILVDKGKKDGVSIGMVVITPEKVLVGKVEQVFGSYSQIALISKKDFTFGIKIETGNGFVTGSARGEGNFGVRAELLPKSEVIEKGDVVSTALSGMEFPENLLVGEIKNSKKDDVKPFQEGEIEPYFRKLSFSNLFLVIPR